jgi:NDP-sugar pyrophosphorylase family protein
VRIGPGAVIGAGAQVGPDAVIGAGARVEPGARVERAVVWAGARVQGDVEDAIVSAGGVSSATS